MPPRGQDQGSKQHSGPGGQRAPWGPAAMRPQGCSSNPCSASSLRLGVLICTESTTMPREATSLCPPLGSE